MNLVSVDTVDELNVMLDMILGKQRGSHWATKPFEPCCVIWRFEGAAPSVGHLRVFDVVPKWQMTPEYWTTKYDEFTASEELRDAAKASGQQWTDHSF